MKKSFVIILSLLISHAINGQISINKSYSNEIQIVTGFAGDALETFETRKTGPTSYCSGATYYRIYKDSLTVGMLLGTENHFDDDLEVALGRNPKDALSSFTQIYEWFQAAQGGASIEFTDVDGRVIQVLKKTLASGSSHINFKVLKNIDVKLIVDELYFTESDMHRALAAFQNNILKFAAYNKLKSLNLIDKYPFAIEYQQMLTDFVRCDAILDSLKNELKIAKKAKDKEAVADLSRQISITVDKKNMLDKETSF